MSQASASLPQDVLRAKLLPGLHSSDPASAASSRMACRSWRSAGLSAPYDVEAHIWNLHNLLHLSDFLDAHTNVQRLKVSSAEQEFEAVAPPKQQQQQSVGQRAQHRGSAQHAGCQAGTDVSKQQEHQDDKGDDEVRARPAARQAAARDACTSASEEEPDSLKHVPKLGHNNQVQDGSQSATASHGADQLMDELQALHLGSEQLQTAVLRRFADRLPAACTELALQGAVAVPLVLWKAAARIQHLRSLSFSQLPGKFTFQPGMFPWPPTAATSTPTTPAPTASTSVASWQHPPEAAASSSRPTAATAPAGTSSEVQGQGPVSTATIISGAQGQASPASVSDAFHLAMYGPAVYRRFREYWTSYEEAVEKAIAVHASTLQQLRLEAPARTVSSSVLLSLAAHRPTALLSLRLSSFGGKSENNPKCGEVEAGLEVSPMSALTWLTHLELCNCGVKPCHPSVLEALQHLQSLSFRHTSIPFTARPNLQLLTSLTSLNLHFAELWPHKPAAFDAFEGALLLPASLADLDIRSFYSMEDGVDLTGLTGLTRFCENYACRIKPPQRNSMGLSGLPGGPVLDPRVYLGLVELNCMLPHFTDWKVLAALPHLTALEVENIPATFFPQPAQPPTAPGLPHACAITNLLSLSIFATEDDKDMTWVHSLSPALLPSLQSLSLKSLYSLDSLNLACLTSLTNLTIHDVDEVNISCLRLPITLQHLDLFPDTIIADSDGPDSACPSPAEAAALVALVDTHLCSVLWPLTALQYLRINWDVVQDPRCLERLVGLETLILPASRQVPDSFIELLSRWCPAWKWLDSDLQRQQHVRGEYGVRLRRVDGGPTA